MTKKEEGKQLDKQLKELLRRIPVKWENGPYISEVNKAIKSTFNHLKKTTLKKLSKKH